MNSIYKGIGFLFVLVFGLSACEKEIDVKLRSVDPILVIEGKIREDSLAMVRLTTTKDFYDDNFFPAVENARVFISDDRGNEETLLLSPELGWYTANNIKGEVGVTYHLNVEHEGNIYTASTTMPPKVTIDSITLTKIPIYDYPIPILHFMDPKGEVNQYYRTIIYLNNSRIKKDNETLSTEFTDGSHIARMVPIFVDEDKGETFEPGDLITIELQSVDKGTYLFFKTMGDVDDSLNNPTSNITGGALGYFAAYPTDVMSIIADW
ncbi:MAG: DUF4249 domain-containing protein [Candidatus Azobacteroides sp.]|nr:DUF4249 domain-containing protein [Candidatus Azobacteroides sp.]